MPISVRDCSDDVISKKEVFAKRWQSTGLLNKLTDASKALDVATLLENAKAEVERLDGDITGQLRNIYVPATYRVCTSMQANNIVSVQPMVDNEPKYFYFDDINEFQAEIKMEEVALSLRALKTAWYPDDVSEVRRSFGLDGIAELVYTLSESIAAELDREIIDEIRMSAAHTWVWNFREAPGSTVKEKYESFSDVVRNASRVIEDETTRGPATWIVSSPTVASLFQADNTFVPAKFVGDVGVKYLGTVLDNVKLYRDNAIPKNELVLGYRGSNPYDAGFFYMPKLLFRVNDVSRDGKQDFFVEYAKKWYSNGSKFFGRIKVVNFIY